MTARRFLNWIRHSTKRVRRLQEERKLLISSMYPGALRLKLVQVQESAPDDKIARVAGDVDVLTARIDAQLDEMEMARAYATEIIGEIRDPRLRDILTLYYLKTYTAREAMGKTHLIMEYAINLSWQDVAWEMQMPVRKVHRLHAEALRAFERMADALPESLPGERR